ncbi:phosphatidate cytidylyltransferase [Treponema sp.]|uniref:phosphatidate cytidylyltransferase n=1 Tax=Treponema sp. TaxID=166 RepID=UPI0025D8D63F|nr:phosphatidate cytidylyltransferase [Treponema sp.]MCR5218345.1 phosphatidate cytidylyltransferase [Treponema sp.]
MSKVISRLGIFFIGIPLMLCLVFLNYLNHLPLHIFLILSSLFVCNELCNIFLKKTSLISKKLIIFFNSLLPFTAALAGVLPCFSDVTFMTSEIIVIVFVIEVILLLAYEVFTVEDFGDSLVRMASSSFIIFYSGFLMTYISRFSIARMGNSDISNQVIVAFLLMVYFCDSFAWFFGVLFGKNNRGIVKASPNKSLIGFFGGIAGSIGAGILVRFIWPEIFTGSIVKIIVTGAVISITSITGDLTESVFKRSAGVKDSGAIIPGRGGVLDSFDSLLMSAPVFYYLIKVFYGFSF